MTAPIRCQCCGFADPVGGVAQHGSSRYVCQLCAPLESDPDREHLAAFNCSLNMLRRDLHHNDPDPVIRDWKCPVCDTYYVAWQGLSKPCCVKEYALHLKARQA